MAVWREMPGGRGVMEVKTVRFDMMPVCLAESSSVARRLLVWDVDSADGPYKRATVRQSSTKAKAKSKASEFAVIASLVVCVCVSIYREEKKKCG